MQKVVIILPTYNEREIIETTIDEVIKNTSSISSVEIKILIVDSVSPDGTGEIVRHRGEKDNRICLLTVNERGLGLGLVKAYEYAFMNLGADIVVQMDADMQHDPRDIAKLLAPFKDGYDFVQGSRFIKGGGNHLELHRRFLSWAANLSARILFNAYQTHEFTTSFRAFSKNIWQRLDFSRIPHRGKSFIFQPAFLNAVLEKKIKIKEVPIIFTDRKKGYSKMDMVRYSFELLRYGLKIQLLRRAKFIKFCVVGFSGAAIQTILFSLLKNKIHPSNATAIGAELAIINGFIWNNLWTFHDRKIAGKRNTVIKFIQYNIGSLGSLVIQWLTLFLAIAAFGRSQFVDWFFYCLGIGIGLIWNFLFYSKIVWKKK